MEEQTIIRLRVSKDEHEEIRRLAALNTRAIQDEYRRAIQEYIRAHKQQ